MTSRFFAGGWCKGTRTEVQHEPRQVLAGGLALRVHQQLRDRRRIQLNNISCYNTVNPLHNDLPRIVRARKEIF